MKKTKENYKRRLLLFWLIYSVVFITIGFFYILGFFKVILWVGSGLWLWDAIVKTPEDEQNN